jgi:hypothetical protein
MIFVCSSAMQSEWDLFLPLSKNKRERLTRNNQVEHELEGCPVLQRGEPAGTLKDQYQKLPG